MIVWRPGVWLLSWRRRDGLTIEAPFETQRAMRMFGEWLPMFCRKNAQVEQIGAPMESRFAQGSLDALRRAIRNLAADDPSFANRAEP